MEVKIPQSKLAKALNYTSRAVSSKPNIPVLANILVEATRTDLHLAATNLDMGINMWIPAQVSVEGSLTVSGKFISDFVNATGDGSVEIQLNKDTLTVITNTAKADFQTIPSQEFPVLPKVSGEPFFVVASTDLIDGLNKTIFACATDLITSRVQHTGVLFEMDSSEPSKLILAGLDGFRMSRKFVPIQRAESETHSLIVPARSLQELVKIVQSEGVETVEVYLNEGKTQIVFKVGEVEVSMRLIEGPYAEYKKVIPEDTAFSFSVAKSELDQAMRIVNTFARTTQGHRVNWDLDLEHGMLTMQSSVSELGNNQVKIAVNDVIGASDYRSAYSLQFLMDMVSHHTGDTIQFGSNSPISPAVFTDPEDSDFVHIVMPLQRDDA